MSKRFGRNQKRALKQVIADVSAAHMLDCELIKKQRQLIDQQHNTLEDIAEIFGEHFIGLEPASTTTSSLSGEIRVYRRSTMAVFPPGSMCDAISNSLARIDAMKTTKVRAWIDDMDRRQHVRVVTPGGEVAYAYTEGAFDGLPRHIVLRKIATAMAEHLITSPETRKIL